MSDKRKAQTDSSESPKRKRDREGSERALLEAAINVFSEHGFDAATTREIAKRAGVSEALIQRYFEGKNGLLLAIMKNYAESCSEEGQESLPLSDSFEKEIEQHLKSDCAEHQDKSAFIRVVLSRAVVDKALGKELGLLVYNRDVAVTKARLLHYQHQGLIPKDADLNSIALFMSFLGFFMGFMGPEVLQIDRSQLDKMGDWVAKVIASGLKP